MSKTVFSCRALPHLVHALAALEKNLTAVKNGFKRAGIYPPDPDAINYDACAPSKKFEDGVQPSEDAEVADAGDEELGDVGGCWTGGDQPSQYRLTIYRYAIIVSFSKYR